MDEASENPLTIVDDPSPTQRAAFVAALERLPINEKLNLLAGDPLGFERMAVYPDGSGVQIAIAFASIEGERDADGLSEFSPELRGALRRITQE